MNRPIINEPDGRRKETDSTRPNPTSSSSAGAKWMNANLAERSNEKLTAKSLGKSTPQMGLAERMGIPWIVRLRDSTKRFLRNAWSCSDWHLYHHVLETRPATRPGSELGLIELTTGDSRLLAEVVRERKLGRPGYHEKRFARELQRGLEDGERLFVAHAERELAGWLRLSPIDEPIWNSGVPLRPGAKELRDLFVTMRFRGTGLVAYYLIIELLRIAQEAGVPQLISLISKENPASLRINQAAGFQPLGSLVELNRLFNRNYVFRPAGG